MTWIEFIDEMQDASFSDPWEVFRAIALTLDEADIKLIRHPVLPIDDNKEGAK